MQIRHTKYAKFVVNLPPLLGYLGTYGHDKKEEVLAEIKKTDITLDEIDFKWSVTEDEGSSVILHMRLDHDGQLDVMQAILTKAFGSVDENIPQLLELKKLLTWIDKD